MLNYSIIVFANFPDVDTNATYSEAVQYLSEWGIITGYENGTFGPNKQVIAIKLDNSPRNRYNKGMYSKDIKEKAIAYRLKHTQRETCEIFGISANALKTWRRQEKSTGTMGNKPKRRRWRKIEPGELLLDVHRNPDAFNQERAEKFGCTGEAIRKAMKKLNITRKKRQ